MQRHATQERNLTLLQPQRAACQLLGNRPTKAGTVLNTASCTLLADLQQGEAAIFQFWPGAHNEQVEANSFSSTGEGRVKEMGLLFPSSASQRSSTFSWTDSSLSMGLLQIGSTQKVTLAHSQLALSFFKIQLTQTQFPFWLQNKHF